MAEITLLTPADHALVSQYLDRVDNRPRPPAAHSKDPRPQAAPSTYVVRPLVNAPLPKRVGATLTRVACGVYRLDAAGDLQPVLLPSGNQAQVLVACTDTQDLAWDYHVADRDRYGAWVVSANK